MSVTDTTATARGLDPAFAQDFAQKLIAAWNSHQPDQLLALMTDDVVYDDSSWPKQMHGHADVREFLESIWRAAPRPDLRTRRRIARRSRRAENVAPLACDRHGHGDLGSARPRAHRPADELRRRRVLRTPRRQDVPYPRHLRRREHSSPNGRPASSGEPRRARDDNDREPHRDNGKAHNPPAEALATHVRVSRHLLTRTPALWCGATSSGRSSCLQPLQLSMKRELL